MANMSFGSGGGSSYYDLARQGKVFCAQAIVTAPKIFSTAAGTGGPLLWNGSASAANPVNAVLLGVTCALTVVTTVAAALGITGNNGQSSAPSTTTAIDTTANLLIGGNPSKCTTYRIGTPSNAGSFFLPLMALHTGALTVDNEPLGFIDLGGMIVVPPNSWVSIAASATATTTVAQLGLVWAEIPLQ
jgi:hypothetical protein